MGGGEGGDGHGLVGVASQLPETRPTRRWPAGVLVVAFKKHAPGLAAVPSNLCLNFVLGRDIAVEPCTNRVFALGNQLFTVAMISVRRHEYMRGGGI